MYALLALSFFLVSMRVFFYGATLSFCVSAELTQASKDFISSANISDTSSPPELAKRIDEEGPDSFIEFFNSDDGLPVRTRVTQDPNALPIWRCVVQLEICLPEKMREIISAATWDAAFLKTEYNVNRLLLASGVIIRADVYDNGTVADTLEDDARFILAEALLRTGIATVKIENSFSCAVQLQTLAIESLPGLASLDKQSIEYLILDSTLIGVKQMAFAELHQEVAQYRKSVTPSSVSGFLKHKSAEIVDRSGDLVFGEVSFVYKKFITLSDESLKEVELVIGDDRLKRFLVSETGRSMTPEKYRGILSCYVDWRKCSQEHDPTAIFEANGIIRSWEYASQDIGKLRHTLTLLLGDRTGDVSNIDEDVKNIVPAVMTVLWYKKFIRGRIGKQGFSENVNHNYFTIAMAIRNYKEIGQDAFEDAMNAPQLRVNPELMRILDKVSVMRLVVVHNEIIEYVETRKFDLTDFLASLDAPLGIVGASRLLMRIIDNFLFENFVQGYGSIMKAIDQYGAEVCAAFFSSQVGRSALYSRYKGFNGLAGCFAEMTKCFTPEQIAFLNSAGWMRTLWLYSGRSPGPYNTSGVKTILNLHEAIDMLIGDDTMEELSDDEASIGVYADNIGYPVFLEGPKVDCLGGNNDRCAELISLLNRNNMMKAIVVRREHKSGRNIELAFGLPKDSVSLSPQRVSALIKIGESGTSRIYNLLVRFNKSRFVLYQIGKPSMINFLDFVGPIMGECENGSALLAELETQIHLGRELGENEINGAQCAFNFDPNWEAKRKSAVDVIVRIDGIFGAIIEFVESLTQKQRLALFGAPDALIQLTAANSIDALAFVVQQAPQDAAKYEEILELCNRVRECQTMLQHHEN